MKVKSFKLKVENIDQVHVELGDIADPEIDEDLIVIQQKFGTASTRLMKKIPSIDNGIPPSASQQTNRYGAAVDSKPLITLDDGGELPSQLSFTTNVAKTKAEILEKKKEKRKRRYDRKKEKAGSMLSDLVSKQGDSVLTYD